MQTLGTWRVCVCNNLYAVCIYMCGRLHCVFVCVSACTNQWVDKCMHGNVPLCVSVSEYTQTFICSPRSCLECTPAEFDLLLSTKAPTRLKIIKTVTEINSLISPLMHPWGFFSLKQNKLTSCMEKLLWKLYSVVKGIIKRVIMN